MGATDLESLFNSDLYLVASSSSMGELLRGRLVLQTMTAAHEAVQPTLMKQQDSNVAGIAWSNIDGGCALNYQVKRGGYSQNDVFHMLQPLEKPTFSQFALCSIHS